MPTVRGEFTEDRRRPYVRAQVLLPRLGVAAQVRLLVDTGADRTTIHWSDREELRTSDGLPLPDDATFGPGVEAAGIAGGSAIYGQEPAILVFDADDGSHVPSVIRVNIELEPAEPAMPSLLGRDVLSEARLDFNMPADELALEWPDDA